MEFFTISLLNGVSYGLLLFIVSKLSDTPLLAVVRDVLPFILAAVCALALMTYVPELVLWLPSWALGGPQ